MTYMPSKKEHAHGACKQMLLYVSMQHQGFFLALRNELPKAIKIMLRGNCI